MAKAVSNAIKQVATFIVVATIASVVGVPFQAFKVTFGKLVSAATASMVFASALVGSLMSKSIEATRGNFGSKFATRAATAPRQIVYGECRVGGTIAHMETAGTDNHMLHMIIVLAGHEIQSVEKVRLNDIDLTSTTSTINSKEVHTVTNSDFTNTDNPNAFPSGRLIRFSVNLGADDQVADNFAVQSLAGTTQGIISTDRFRGCAYVYMQMIYDSEKFGGGMPAVSFQIKGKKVFDPRDSSTAFSSNPALIIRDYLSDTTYGLKALSTEINDSTSAGGFAAAANICDQDVTLADGSTTEKRYTANGFTNMSATGTGIIEGLLTSMAGQLTYTNGKFNVFAGAAQTPSLTITDDNLLEPVSLSTKNSTGELYNTVKPAFVDASRNFIANDAPVFQDSTFLTEDTPNGTNSDKPNFVKQMEVQFPFTTTHTMAQRLGRIALLAQRQTMTLSLLVDLKFMQLQPVDWVYVDNERLGFSQRVFEVVNWSLELAGETDSQILACRLQLKEASSSVFTFGTSDYQAAVASGSDVPAGGFQLSPPTNLSIATDTTSVDVLTTTSVTVSWTNAASPHILGTEVQFKRSSDSIYTTNFANKGATKQQILSLEVGVTYNFKVRHLGLKSFSSTVTANHTVGGTATAKSALTNSTVNYGSDGTGTLPSGKGGTGITDFANSTHKNSNTTKDDVGLGNVDNESSATIRGQETSGNHTGTIGGTANSTIVTGATRANATIDSNNRFTGDLTGNVRSNGTTKTPAEIIDAHDRSIAGLDSSGNVQRAVPQSQLTNVITFSVNQQAFIWSEISNAGYVPTATSFTFNITWKDGNGTTVATSRWVATRDTTNDHVDNSGITNNVTGSGVTSSVTGGDSTFMTVTFTKGGTSCTVSASLVTFTGFTFKSG